MRSTRLPAVVLAVAIIASGLAGILTRPDPQDPRPQTRAEAGPAPRIDRSQPTAAGAEEQTASPQVSRGAERPSQSSDLDPVTSEGPARTGPQTEDTQTMVVRFREGLSDEEMKAAVQAVGAEPISVIPALNAVVASIDPDEREDAETSLQLNPLVAAVEPNGLRYAFADPFDPGYWDQGHLHVSRLPVAWEVTKGSKTLDIAILDTGVDLDHPDLKPRIVAGKDFVNNDNIAADDEGHGTMVAGIAAAETDNFIGVAGVAWNARIIPVKVLGADGSGTDGNIANGIVWAADNGAEVINLSLGGPGESSLLSSAVAYAISKGVVVVAAAGNESSSEPSYPAAIEGVISVGATDLDGDLAPFTNFGPWVDLVAPGVDMVTTFLAPGPNEAYAFGDGTSFSAPVVAGVALLARAKNPAWTPAQIASRIIGSAADRGPRGIDHFYGYGLLDAYAAVGGRTAGSPPAPSDPTNEPNDVPDRATVVSGPTTASLVPEGDVDWFAVDALLPGSITLGLTWSAVEGLDFVPSVSAYSPDLDLLLESTGAAVGSMNLDLAVPVGGRYTFKVENTAPTRSPEFTVRATLSVDPFEGDPAGERIWVYSTTPADRAEGADASAKPTVTFARDIDPGTISTSTVRMIDGTTGAEVPALPSYDVDTRTVELAPVAALASSRTYLVEVRDVADDLASVMSDPYLFRFTVAAQASSRLVADINGDGYDDVVVGVPNEAIGSRRNAGLIHILYGSPTGVKGGGSQMIHQDTAGVPGAVEAGDLFGASVATGDVNNDGYADVAVGAPGEALGSIKGAGVVHLFLGSPSGLRTNGSQMWSQDTSGVPEVAEAGDRFGTALAFGDFDNVPGADLAIGSPGESVGSLSRAGAIHILSGRPNGLTAAGARVWTQNDIDGFSAPGNLFGLSLGAGDFDGDTHDDLAVSAPFESIYDDQQGSVSLFRGTIVGLRPIFTFWSDLVTGNDSPRKELYGASLAVGDFGGLGFPDGYADLAIGAPGAGSNRGRVDVLFSDWLGVGRIIHSRTQIGDPAEAGDTFGASLAARKVSGMPVAWLAIGAPGESIGSKSQTGVVHMELPSTWLGSPVNKAPFSQDSTGVPSASVSGDRFGTAVGILDVDGDGKPDLVVGTPNKKVGSASAAGVVHVLRRAHNPTAVGGQLLSQNSSGVAGNAETGDRFGSALG